MTALELVEETRVDFYEIEAMKSLIESDVLKA